MDHEFIREQVARKFLEAGSNGPCTRLFADLEPARGSSSRAASARRPQTADRLELDASRTSRRDRPADEEAFGVERSPASR